MRSAQVVYSLVVFKQIRICLLYLFWNVYFFGPNETYVSIDLVKSQYTCL